MVFHLGFLCVLFLYDAMKPDKDYKLRKRFERLVKKLNGSIEMVPNKEGFLVMRYEIPITQSLGKCENYTQL